MERRRIREMLTKIFFCTDVHGSTKCFRKVVTAGEFYKVDVVILGGDLTGKAFVPLVRQGDGTFTSNFLGRKWILKDEKALREHEKLITDTGWYVYETTPEEMEELRENKERINEIFREKVVERLREWVEIAESNLKAKKRTIIVTPGNDDPQYIDSIFEESEVMINSEGKVIDLDGCHEMLSSGWSNPTPWDTPRECSEEDLAKRIEAMASKINNIENSIFNLHAPPFGSGLDNAPKLSKDLQIEASGEFEPVGSTAVLNAIKKYQPLLGLHGHIHEGMGKNEIGRTLCINPGSNYTEGILNGIIIALDEKRVKGTMFTSG
jgi:Icc-related predicted phosphoesterase